LYAERLLNRIGGAFFNRTGFDILNTLHVDLYKGLETERPLRKFRGGSLMKTFTLSAVLVLVSMFLVLGCSSTPKVKEGDKVQVNYVGTLDDGTVFDSSEGKAPLEFVVGGGQMIAGFDKAVLGMTVGEKKDITLTPDEAYGYPSDDRILEVDKSQFPPDLNLEVGMDLVGPGGFPVKVKEITDSSVMIDANHPLAGKTLHFAITLMAINPPGAVDETMPQTTPQPPAGSEPPAGDTTTPDTAAAEGGN
jgi:FKBP-type peptidyl-prolyl cis-trans isomerase 2